MKSLQAANALAGNLLSMAGSRLELFSAELQREKSRLALLIVCACVGGGCALLTLAGLAATAVFLTPEDFRWITMLASTLFFAGVVIVCAIILAQILLRASRPFAETTDELRKDALCLKDLVKSNESRS